MIKNVHNMINLVMQIQIKDLVVADDFGGFGGFEDIFSTFFGGGGARRRDPNAPRQGADLTIYDDLRHLKKLFLVKKRN